MITIATVQSRVLRANPMGDPADRRVPVYLPSDYETSKQRYPVVYFLAGFSGSSTGNSYCPRTRPARNPETAPASTASTPPAIAPSGPAPRSTRAAS